MDHKCYICKRITQLRNLLLIKTFNGMTIKINKLKKELEQLLEDQDLVCFILRFRKPENVSS